MTARTMTTRRRPLRVSAAEVARAAGVSPATVSYVMNGRPGVSEQTRARVLEVAQEMGHTSSERADRLRSGQTRVIGLVLTDIANPFYTEIAAGTIDAARALGYEVFLAHTQERSDTLRSVVEAMVARHVDGIVLTVLHPDDGDIVRTLHSAHIPMVQVSRRIERVDADFVGIDDRAAAAEMMEHVVAHGYRDIATIVGPRTSSASAARELGFAGRRRCPRDSRRRQAPDQCLSQRTGWLRRDGRTSGRQGLAACDRLRQRRRRARRDQRAARALHRGARRCRGHRIRWPVFPARRRWWS